LGGEALEHGARLLDEPDLPSGELFEFGGDGVRASEGPSQLGGRRSPAGPPPGNLLVEVLALEGAGTLPSLTVAVRLGAWEGRLSGRAGDTLRFELPSSGDGTASIVESNSWLADSIEFHCSEESGASIGLVAVPRRIITGRVLDSGTREPIERFRISTESVLTSGPGGTSKYKGSPNHLEDRKGRFSLIPYQNAGQHRLEFESDGYDAVSSDWFEVQDSGRVDLGDLLMTSREVSTVTLSVVSAQSGLGIGGADVLVSRKTIADQYLVVSDGLLSSNAKFEQRLRTDDSGKCQFEVARDARYYLLVCDSIHQMARRVLDPSATLSREVSISLASGGAIECSALIPDSTQVNVINRRFEVRAGTAQRQAGALFDPNSNRDVVSIGGLPTGPAEVRFVGDSVSPGGSFRKVFLAKATVEVLPMETQTVNFDLFVPLGVGVNGRVSLPQGDQGAALTASWYTQRDQVIPDRGTGVVESVFRLPCDSNTGLLAVNGLADSQDVAYAWFCPSNHLEVEGSVNVDLGRTEVVGEHGALDPEFFEVIVVTPSEGHPLFGARGAEVRVYPSRSGAFRVFGLPDGPYKAVADFTGKQAYFEIKGPGMVRVQLTRAQ